EQDGGVAVMPAGMHHAGSLAGVRQTGDFGDREGVHIGTDADGAAARALPQRADYAGAADAGRDLVAPAGQEFGDQRAGLELLIGQLRLRVEPVPERNKLGDIDAHSAAPAFAAVSSPAKRLTGRGSSRCSRSVVPMRSREW